MQKVTDYGIPAVLLSTVMDGDGVWCHNWSHYDTSAGVVSMLELKVAFQCRNMQTPSHRSQQHQANVEESITTGKFDHATATFHLLAQQVVRGRVAPSTS